MIIISVRIWFMAPGEGRGMECRDFGGGFFVTFGDMSRRSFITFAPETHPELPVWEASTRRSAPICGPGTGSATDRRPPCARSRCIADRCWGPCYSGIRCCRRRCRRCRRLDRCEAIEPLEIYVSNIITRHLINYYGFELDQVLQGLRRGFPTPDKASLPHSPGKPPPFSIVAPQNSFSPE